MSKRDYHPDVFNIIRTPGGKLRLAVGVIFAAIAGVILGVAGANSTLTTVVTTGVGLGVASLLFIPHYLQWRRQQSIDELDGESATQ